MLIWLNKSIILQLSFDNVKVQSVEVTATGLPRNEFSTFWQQSDIELSRGLDFAPRGSVFARITHLQHAPFSYKIIVSKLGKLYYHQIFCFFLYRQYILFIHFILIIYIILTF